MDKKPISFTPAQQAAIDCDVPFILVSAAAGSGKTAVLTARIMRHIEQGNGLERLLVVTFTEAAAAGMKEKVTERLQAGAFPRQMALLPGADISTIHAFCRKLVKMHFQQVGLDPAFRVGDEAELGLIKAQVMDEVFEAGYQDAAENDLRGFLDLADVYGGKAKDDRLDTLVRKLYDFLESDPFPATAAARYALMFEKTTDLENTPWAAIVREELTQGLNGAAQSLTRARALCQTPGGPDKYIERLEEDAEQIRYLQGQLTRPLENLYQAFTTVSWGTLPRVTQKDAVDTTLKERVQHIRNENVKKAIDKLVKGVFFAPIQKMAADITNLIPRVQALMDVTQRFAAAYAAEKRARNLLDFSDLEHFAIQILYPNGPNDLTPGPIAEALQRKYHEVLIDEYQDANRVQELILSAVSGRRFMVGDVKQSIYRFRRANPLLFREKYDAYTRFDALSDDASSLTNGLPSNSGETSAAGWGSCSGSAFNVLRKNPTPPPMPPGAGGLGSSLNAQHDPRQESLDPNTLADEQVFVQGTLTDLPEPSNPGTIAGRQGFLRRTLNALPEQEPLPSGEEGTCKNSIREIGIRIDLNQNFRSRAEVLAGINFFFSRMMCPAVGEVLYDDAAALKPGADYPAWPGGAAGRVQVDLLDEGIEEEGEGDLERGDEGEAGAVPERITPLVNEARMIACRIHDLLKTQKVWDAGAGGYRPCRFSDMVILTRSLTHAPEIIEALKGYHVPAVAEMGEDFFAQVEVKTALAFLRVVDNPRQDIELLTVLHGPVYGVDADELAAIRGVQGEGDFYDCLRVYAGINENDTGCVPASADGVKVLKDKLVRFFDDLTRFRAAAGILPISRLLNLIYTTTDYPAFAAAMPGGAARAANLQMLLERAMAFEETRLTGLFHFTLYLRKLEAVSFADRTAAVHAAGDSVRLMSIHKSKGLEFPIVFVSFLGRKFNVDDEKQPVILHGEGGIGPFYTDTALRTQSNTLPRFSLQRLTRRENLSEEMRCLYVAMTRAMEKLILTGRCADLTKDVEKWSEAGGDELPVYYKRGATRFLDWLMPFLINNPEAAGFALKIWKSNEVSASSEIIGNAPIFPVAMQEGNVPLTLTRHETAPGIPSKLSISEIKRLYNSDLTPESTHPEPLLPPIFEPPNFIREAQGLTPMRMGSILHTLTEHLDYHIHTTQPAVDILINELIEKNLLTSDEAKAVERQKILTLTHSSLGERIRRSARLYREVPFVMATPANEIYPSAASSSSEKILVHGIIDAYFEEGGEIVLIDFKSDHAANIHPDELLKTHATQLTIYKKALTQATKKPVKEVLLYSFSLGLCLTLF